VKVLVAERTSENPGLLSVQIERDLYFDPQALGKLLEIHQYGK